MKVFGDKNFGFSGNRPKGYPTRLIVYKTEMLVEVKETALLPNRRRKIRIFLRDTAQTYRSKQ